MYWLELLDFRAQKIGQIQEEEEKKYDEATKACHHDFAHESVEHILFMEILRALSKCNRKTIQIKKHLCSESIDPNYIMVRKSMLLQLLKCIPHVSLPRCAQNIISLVEAVW